MDAFAKIFSLVFLQFNVPPSTGNLSFVRHDTAFIHSAATVSGWVVSAKQSLRNKRLRAKIVKSGWDGSFSISPKVDYAATDGFYSHPTRLRLCPYGLPRTLHVEWKRNGVYSALAVGAAGNDPFWVAMAFVNDSVRFERSNDGKAWQTLWREPFNLPGYSLADSFYVELQAHKTPTGGEMIATHVELEDLLMPPEPLPVKLEGTTATIEWYKNVEVDLAGYRLHYGRSSRQYEFNVDVGLKTSAIVMKLLSHTVYYFAVTAYDTAGNVSSFSNEVSARTGDDPVLPIEYDVNQNGEVDIFDWLYLLRLMGYAQGHPKFNATADLTGDGEIDGFDKAKFARQAGVF